MTYPENKFKVGDLVLITHPSMHGDYGVIVKQGKFPARYRRDQLGAVGLEFLERVGTTEWLVHLIDGREVWLWTDWLANV